MTDKKTILIVDDDENIREINSTIVSRMFPDYQNETFVDGTSLKNRLEKSVDGVKLVITDNDMPGINGSEIIRLFARDSQFPFILAYGGDESVGKRAVENGAFGYLLKPYDVIDLKNKVQEALNSRKYLAEMTEDIGVWPLEMPREFFG